MRLLLADDNPAILDNLVNILQGNFVVAGAFTDGGSVLEQSLRLTPDIVILDISMGDLTGFEVARRLRKMGCQARVIFLTVHEDIDFVQAAFLFGASAYVFKSTLNQDLIPAINAASGDRLFYPRGLLEARG